MAECRKGRGCITLIGMPACGKSTVGVVLAKKLGMRFIDTDLVIQEQTGKLLKELIAEHGDEGFRAIEDRINASIEAENAVIAPGGSAVYGKKAMAHFRELGQVVYLKLPYYAVVLRIGDLKERGVSIRPGQTFYQLYRERTRLYEKYADLVVDERRLPIRAVVKKILLMTGRELPEALKDAEKSAAAAEKKEKSKRIKKNGKRNMAAGQHAVPGPGSHGKLRRQRRPQ